MILYSTSILALPCMLVVWAIDSYLFLVLLRGVGGRFLHVTPGRSWCSGLSALADPLPGWVMQWLARRNRKTVPPWAGSAVVVCGLLIVRSVLMSLVLAAA